MVEINIKYENKYTNDIVTVISIEPCPIQNGSDTIVLSDGKKWDETTFLNHHKKVED